MPRLVEEDEGLPIYVVVCDQCGVRGPAQESEEAAAFGFEQPPDTEGVYLCETCSRMDVGQEDWLIRYTPANDHQQMMMQAEIAELRMDAHVLEVDLDHPGLVRATTRIGEVVCTVRFVPGARRPRDEELARRVEARRTREAPSPFVQQLIQIHEGAETGGSVLRDTRPGTIARTLIEVADLATQQRVEVVTLERCRNALFTHLEAQLGPDVPLNQDSHLRRVVERIAAAAYEARRPQTEAEIRQQVVQAFADAQDRPAMAASMIGPLRRQLDYQGIGRRLFAVEQMPGGALPVYNRPVEPAPLPEWCYVGGWVRRLSDDVVARITEVTETTVSLKTEARPPPWDGLLSWDRMLHTRMTRHGKHVSGDEPIPFDDEWEPSEDPAPPRSAWERLGQEAW